MAYLTNSVRVLMCAGVLASGLFMGCEPPEPAPKDSGRTIHQIAPRDKAPFQTVEMDGVEFKQTRDSQGQFGGVFYDTSIGSGPKTLNPHASKDATSSMIGGLMFTGLTDIDPYTGEILPHLAKSVALQSDNMTYIVTLRKGLTWSDGHPITADDVVFTWNEIIKKGLGNPSSRDIIAINGRLPRVTKRDQLTIVFKTPEPFAPFQGNLGMAIYPKHVVAPVIQSDAKAFDSFWGVNADPKSFVVNGPFIIEEYQTGQRIVLKRNPHYFMVDTHGKRLPYLDQYIIDFVQDQNAQVLAFEQGRVDRLSIPGKQLLYIKHLQNPKFEIYDLGPSTGTSFIVLNLNNRRKKSTGKSYVDPVKSAWFRDLNFRKALDWGIDRDGIVQNILMGVGARLHTAESLSSIYLNESLAKGHPRDVEQAKAYLQASGFYWDANGKLFDKQGHLVEFEVLTNAGNLEREAVGVSIKEDLEALGITVNFKAIEFNVLVGKMDTSEWEAVILGLTGGNTEPHGGKNVWHSQGALHLFNQRIPKRDMPGSDRVEPWEKQLDRLFYQGSVTLDVPKRHEIYDQYQAIVAEQLPIIYLYSPKTIIGVRSRIQNLDPTPLGVFHNLESLWIKE